MNESSDSDTDAPAMRRSLGFWALTIYGIGDILGAGIYALIGTVAGEAGPAAWLAFLVAMVVAGLTSASYAELVCRYPRSGGEAAFSLEAFGSPRVSFLIGWLVLWSGVVSMSAVAHGCADYLVEFADIPQGPVWITFLAIVASINVWGIRQSSLANVVFTLIEASGLLLVIVAGLWFLARGGIPLEGAGDAVRVPSTWGVLSGAAVAFYAFIGFEDMVNIAEEVREPQRTFPRAMTVAIIVCGAMCAAVSLVALAVVPAERLAGSDGPLLEVVRHAAPAVPESLFTLIALVAVANTGLLNAIMGSRLLFGMARDGLLPQWIAAIHPKTGTPHRAVLLVFVAGLVLVFSGALPQLASTTSLLLLTVFITVNGSLLRIRRREKQPASGFTVPLPIPMLAMVSSGVLIVFVDPDALLLGLSIMGVGAIVALFLRRTADSRTSL